MGREVRRVPADWVHPTTDERRAWVAVWIGKDGGLWPYWAAAALTELSAKEQLLKITTFASWRQAYRAGVRMMRCAVEVPNGRKTR